MMETDNLSRNRSMGRRDGSPRDTSPRPMRQLEFNQAMSDFRHMFPETDEEVIEAVLRANSGMVDATIDQLLTMNIDAEFDKEDEDDLPDHVLVSMEQEVMAEQQMHQPVASGVRDRDRDREGMSKSSRKALEAFSSSRQDSEDCPPSYTEAVQSHLSHPYRGNSSSSRRHKQSSSSSALPPASTGLIGGGGGGFTNNGSGSPAINNGLNSSNNISTGNRLSNSGHLHHHRLPRHGMQHLLDLGPDSAPTASAATSSSSGKISPTVGAGSSDNVAAASSAGLVTQASGGVNLTNRSQHHSRHHHHHHHHHHHPQGSRSSNHTSSSRRTRATPDNNSDNSSPHHKSSSSSSRPGRNLLASMTSSPHSHSSPSYTHHELASEEFGFIRPQNRKEASFDSVDHHHQHSESSSRREKSPSHHWQSSSGRESTSFKRPAFRNWNPPMLGTLPDDFLRIASISGSHAPTHHKHAPNLHRAMSAIGPERPARFSASSNATDIHGSQRSPRVDSSQMTSSSFRHGGRSPSSSSSSNKPHRSLSFAGHTQRSELPKRALTTLHPSANLSQHEFRSDILQEKMKENERRRHMAASSGLDPELTQFLEDERLAIMLQNSEFLQTLRGDRTFMMSLEEDHSGQEFDEPPSSVLPEMTVTESSMVVPPTVNPNGLGSDEEEGYGDEGRQTLEAFPFSKRLPPPANSEDMELRKKLKHMGKSSRKQFAALARKFFSKRKKKNAHQILKESQAPSMMNLLGDEEEEDDLEEVNNGGLISVSDPYNYNYNSTASGNMRNSWNERQGRHFDEV